MVPAGAVKEYAAAGRLTVKDDGCGFDLDATDLPQHHSGIGLVGMRERLELLGGRLELRASPGQGLRLAALLPLQAEP